MKVLHSAPLHGSPFGMTKLTTRSYLFSLFIFFIFLALLIISRQKRIVYFNDFINRINRNMKRVLILSGISLILTGCQFSKTVEKDLISGLSSKGNIISCEDVYITVNEERTKRNSFIYGETFFINFGDINGLTKLNDYVFPGLDMIVLSSMGDTLINVEDLITDNPEGMNFSPLLLTADLTVADPLRSGNKYTLIINIRDKMGKGTYLTKFDFAVKSNDRITVETTSGVTYNEVFLYSRVENKIITDGNINTNETIYIIIKGLKGFKEDKGIVIPGLKLKITDASQNIVVEEDDLLTQYGISQIFASDMAEHASGHFTIYTADFKNPLQCEMTIWDQNSEARIWVFTDVILNQEDRELPVVIPGGGDSNH